MAERQVLKPIVKKTIEGRYVTFLRSKDAEGNPAVIVVPSTYSDIVRYEMANARIWKGLRPYIL